MRCSTGSVLRFSRCFFFFLRWRFCYQQGLPRLVLQSSCSKYSSEYMPQFYLLACVQTWRPIVHWGNLSTCPARGFVIMSDCSRLQRADSDFLCSENLFIFDMLNTKFSPQYLIQNGKLRDISHFISYLSHQGSWGRCLPEDILPGMSEWCIY